MYVTMQNYTNLGRQVLQCVKVLTNTNFYFLFQVRNWITLDMCLTEQVIMIFVRIWIRLLLCMKYFNCPNCDRFREKKTMHF